MNKPKFSANLLMPQHWPVWIVIGLFAALTFLPYRLQLSLGKGLGLLAYTFVGRRRHVAEVNIGLCFPEKSRSEEHTSELQSRPHLVCRLLLEKKKNKQNV